MNNLGLSIIRTRTNCSCFNTFLRCRQIPAPKTRGRCFSILNSNKVKVEINPIPCGRSSRYYSKGPPKAPAEDKQGPLAAFMNLPNDGRSIAHSIFGPDSDWITIYRFGHIVTARVIQRAKIFQTAFSVFIVLPVTFFSTLQGALAPETFTLIAGGSGFACLMLFVMGNLFSNLVGIIYVTEKDPEIVRIAHMTFWGTREDEIYKKMDFVPFGDLPDNVQDAYVKLRLYSDPEHVLKMSLKYGTIFDDERFFEVFGNCEDLVVKRKTKEKDKPQDNP